MSENNVIQRSMPRWLQVLVAICTVAVAGSMIYAVVVRPELNRWRLDRCLAKANTYPEDNCGWVTDRVARQNCQIALRGTTADKIRDLCFKQYPVR